MRLKELLAVMERGEVMIEETKDCKTVALVKVGEDAEEGTEDYAEIKRLAEEDRYVVDSFHVVPCNDRKAFLSVMVTKERKSKTLKNIS